MEKDIRKENNYFNIGYLYNLKEVFGSNPLGLFLPFRNNIFILINYINRF
jgi:hypothetical protein